MSAALMAQPGLHRMATAVSKRAKSKGKKEKEKSTMAGGACATVMRIRAKGGLGRRGRG